MMYTSHHGYTSQWWALESRRIEPLNRLNGLPRTSLRMRVVNAIPDPIAEGRFWPGEKTPEKQLAEEFGVSRTPVRETIHTLEQQRLVEIQHLYCYLGLGRGPRHPECPFRNGKLAQQLRVAALLKL